MKTLEFKEQINVIKTDKFNTLDFIMIFPCVYNKKDIGHLALMRQNILNTSKQFPTEQSFKSSSKKIYN